MKRIHIVGKKNHGKTQLLVELIQELTSRGLQVGSIKHTHHHHELDTPGKDSHRHRLAGAAVVGILSRNMNAVFIPTSQASAGEERYAALSLSFANCDVVIVEGDSQSAAPKIEVWRAALGTEPLAADDPTILAVITDDAIDLDVILYRRSDVPQLASWILEHIH